MLVSSTTKARTSSPRTSSLALDPDQVILLVPLIYLREKQGIRRITGIQMEGVMTKFTDSIKASGNGLAPYVSSPLDKTMNETMNAAVAANVATRLDDGYLFLDGFIKVGKSTLEEKLSEKILLEAEAHTLGLCRVYLNASA